MAYSHTSVQLAGFHFEDSLITFKLDSGLTADHVGEPIALKTGVNGTVKRGADGERIHGYLQSYEDRTVEGAKVGAVALRLAQRFKVKTADTLAVGDCACCAGNGEVRKMVVATDELPVDNVVVEVVGGYAVVHKI
jgi:hypothetical protein